jgi:hypothetical protein
MSDCNATIGTYTAEPCPHDGYCAHQLCLELELGDDLWRHLALHKIPCSATDGPHVRHIYIAEGSGARLFWEDATRGAVPHVDSEQLTASEWDRADRDGCCADWPEPCQYHEGWNDGHAAAEDTPPTP